MATEGEIPSMIFIMVKRRILLTRTKNTISFGFGELKKDIKTTSKTLTPNLKKKKKLIKSFLTKEKIKSKRRPSTTKKRKRKRKRKIIKNIKSSLGYNHKLNLGGLY